MKNFFLIFLFFVLFAIIGLILTINSGVTGHGTYLNTPKFVSCRYESQDKWGPCYYSEKQIGTKCIPEETLPRSKNYYSCVEKDAQNCPTPTNWFYRPCSYGNKFSGGQNPTFA